MIAGIAGLRHRRPPAALSTTANQHLRRVRSGWHRAPLPGTVASLYPLPPIAPG